MYKDAKVFSYLMNLIEFYHDIMEPENRLSMSDSSLIPDNSIEKIGAFGTKRTLQIMDEE